MNLVDVDRVDRVERVEVANDNGTVFIGTKVWSPHTTGVTFPQADLAEARRLIGAAYIAGNLDLWQVVLDFATSKGYNVYYANMLAGHCWTELL